MLKKLLILFIIIHVYFNSSSQNTYWQQQVNYTIDVSLNNVDRLQAPSGYLQNADEIKNLFVLSKQKPKTVSFNIDLNVFRLNNISNKIPL